MRYVSFRQLLRHRQHRLDVLAHVEHDGRVGRALHVAGHDLALAGRILLEDDVALGLAEPLPVYLAGGLRRDPSELRLGHVLRDCAPSHRRRWSGRSSALPATIIWASGSSISSAVAIHLVLASHADLAALGVDRDDHVLGGIGVAPVGGLDGLLQGPDQDLLWDTLFGVQLEQCSDEISIHGRSSLPRRVDYPGQTKTWEANRPTSPGTQFNIVARRSAGRTVLKYTGLPPI